MECVICKKLIEDGGFKVGECQDANSSRAYFRPAIYGDPLSLDQRPFFHHLKEDNAVANITLLGAKIHGTSD